MKVQVRCEARATGAARHTPLAEISSSLTTTALPGDRETSQKRKDAKEKEQTRCRLFRENNARAARRSLQPGKNLNARAWMVFRERAKITTNHYTRIK